MGFSWRVKRVSVADNRTDPDIASPSSLRRAAAQLREDAVDEWGIRRKMNMRAAAVILEAAARRIEHLERK